MYLINPGRGSGTVARYHAPDRNDLRVADASTPAH